MKYFSKKQIEELRGVASRYPAAKVDFEHHSLVLFERVMHNGDTVIKFGDPDNPGVNAAGQCVELLDKLNALRWDDAVIDELGDERELYAVKSMVLNSMVLRNGGVSGPVKSLLPQEDPAPPSPKPAAKPEEF